jgi:hypothetical protein
MKKANKDYMQKIKSSLRGSVRAGDISKDQAFDLNEKAKLKISWNNLTYTDKARLFNSWSIIILAGNFFQVVGSVMYMARDFIPLETEVFFIGFGCLLGWISIMKYIEYAPKFSFFSRTV